MENVTEYVRLGFEVLGYADDWESLNNLESLWIIVSNAVECGYNRKIGIGSPCPETRKRMSEAQKRNPNRYWTGKKRPDTSERNRIFFTGRPSPKKLPPKPKPQPKDRHGENNHFFGKTHDNATRQKMSESVKRGLQKFKNTPEWKEHQRNASLARWAKYREAKRANS